MFLFFLVTGALIALCSASTCNVYRVEEKGIQTVPYKYICCNNTHQTNCAGNVYGIGSDSNYCSAEGKGKVGFQFGTSFECGSCSTQIKCAEKIQQSPHNAKRWAKEFKKCCFISSNLDVETNHNVFLRQVSFCGDGICDIDEQKQCNCTQDCPINNGTSTGKTTHCRVGPADVKTDNKTTEILIGVFVGVGFFVILCCIGIGICIAACAKCCSGK